MVNLSVNQGLVFGLRVYTGILLAATVLGTLFILSSVKPVTFYFAIVCFVFLSFFCCAPNRIIFSKIGKLISYSFCIAIACRFVYEIYFPREFITYAMFLKSQIYIVIAALLWLIFIRKIITNDVA